MLPIFMCNNTREQQGIDIFVLVMQFSYVVLNALTTSGIILISGPSDARYIRVETCMFMVKLPQYSTQERMTEKLLYAINCREDPLTDIT